MVATRDGNHVESATQVVRHTTRMWDMHILLRIQKNIQTYDDTLPSQNQKRDWFKSGRLSRHADQLTTKIEGNLCL